jgi:hypothetical protein
MMAGAGETGLQALAATELDSPAPEAAQAILRLILARHGDSVAAVLFYGSCRREGGSHGLLDLYVLYDRHRDFHAGTAAAVLTAVLPPHVVFLGTDGQEPAFAAKVASMSLRQFGRRMRLHSLDTTLWARFCQPATLLYARDAGVRLQVLAALACGIRTAAGWALRFAPAGADASVCWTLLFARTYAAELRPERGNRPALIYGADPAWFDRALSLVRAELLAAGELPVGRTRRSAWLAAWALRRAWGKPLNLLRLVKAAMTFEGGTDYLVAKLERHLSVRVVPSAWQRRHPLLAAPVLLWRAKTRR